LEYSQTKPNHRIFFILFYLRLFNRYNVTRSSTNAAPIVQGIITTRGLSCTVVSCDCHLSLRTGQFVSSVILFHSFVNDQRIQPLVGRSSMSLTHTCSRRVEAIFSYCQYGLCLSRQDANLAFIHRHKQFLLTNVEHTVAVAY
jgi:hypothetical protein